MQNATVQSNTFVDDRYPHVMPYGIFEETNNLGSDVYGGEPVAGLRWSGRPRVPQRTRPSGSCLVVQQSWESSSTSAPIVRDDIALHSPLTLRMATPAAGPPITAPGLSCR